MYSIIIYNDWIVCFSTFPSTFISMIVAAESSLLEFLFHVSSSYYDSYDVININLIDAD